MYSTESLLGGRCLRSGWLGTWVKSQHRFRVHGEGAAGLVAAARDFLLQVLRAPLHTPHLPLLNTWIRLCYMGHPTVCCAGCAVWRRTIPFSAAAAQADPACPLLPDCSQQRGRSTVAPPRFTLRPISCSPRHWLTPLRRSSRWPVSERALLSLLEPPLCVYVGGCSLRRWRYLSANTPRARYSSYPAVHSQRH